MDRILEILNGIHPRCDFKGSVDFIEDELLDSFDVIELVDCLEKEFNIRIDGLDILPGNFKNLKAIQNMVIKNGGTI